MRIRAACVAALTLSTLAAGAATAGAAVRTIPGGPQPMDVIVQPTGVWVLGGPEGAATMRLINPATNKRVGPPAPVGTLPTDSTIASFRDCCQERSVLTAAAGDLWTIDASTREVVRFDAATRTVVARIPTTGQPRDLVTGPGGLFMLDACVPPPVSPLPCTSRAITRIDTSTNSFGASVAFDQGFQEYGTYGPLQFQVGTGGVFWVSRPASRRTLTIVTGPGAIQDRRTLPAGWVMATRGPNTLWSATRAGCQLVKVTGSGDAEIFFGALGPGQGCRPRGITTTGDGHVWVLLARSSNRSQVVRFNPSTRRVVATFLAGRDSTAIAAGAGSVWVTNKGDNTVTRIDR